MKKYIVALFLGILLDQAGRAGIKYIEGRLAVNCHNNGIKLEKCDFDLSNYIDYLDDTARCLATKNTNINQYFCRPEWQDK